MQGHVLRSLQIAIHNPLYAWMVQNSLQIMGLPAAGKSFAGVLCQCDFKVWFDGI